MQKHGRVHIGDYSPTEFVVDADEDEDHARNGLHGTTSMQDRLMDGREEASYGCSSSKTNGHRANQINTAELDVVVDEQTP
jgi:hypothetical protein